MGGQQIQDEERNSDETLRFLIERHFHIRNIQVYSGGLEDAFTVLTTQHQAIEEHRIEEEELI
jgi:hypothetical protein